MIGGEPGIGKTRLAEEISVESRNRGAIALIGRCQDTDSPLPYAPWVEMTNTIARIAPREAFRKALGEDASEMARLSPEIRRMFPDIPESLRLPPEQERQYLFNSIVNYLERSTQIQPLVLILDDLQWADEASLLLLTQVAQRASEMRILIIGTYRDIELEVARPLARTLEDLLRRRLAHRVTLRRFSEEVVERLLLSLAENTRSPRGSSTTPPPPGLVKVIYRETEGNPFFVEEVFQHLNEEGRLFSPGGSWQTGLVIDELEVPESVRLVIGRRLEKLSDQTRRILVTASLIGPAFSYELLEDLEGGDPDALVDAMDEAEAAHLIVSSRQGMHTRIAFAHELIRQTLLSGVSVPRRQRLHSRIAETMEASYNQTGRLFDHATEIAHHLYQSGGGTDPEKTVRYLSLAGDLAINAAAFDEARRHYEQAIEFQMLEDAQLADLQFKLGFAQRGMGHWDEALARWNVSLSIYERLHDETGGRVARAIAYQLSWAGQTHEALEVAQRGLAIIPDSSLREKARLLAVAAMETGLLADPDAYHMIEEAEQIAKAAGHERTVLEVLAARAVIEWGFARPLECFKVARDAAEKLKHRGDLFQWVGISAFVEGSLTMMGRFKEADKVALEFAPTAESLGHLGALIPHRRASVFRSGRFTGEDIESDAALDEEQVGQLGSAWLGQAMAWRAVARFYQGDWEGSLELALGPGLEEVEGIYQDMNPAGFALVLAFMGETRSALELLDRIDLPVDLDLPIPSGRKMLMAAAPQVLTLAGDRKRAAELYPFTLKVLDQKLVFGFFNSCPHQLSAAAAAAAAGDWAAADGHFSEAVKICEELELRLQLPIAYVVWGTALRRWAPPERQHEATSTLIKASELFEQLKMKRHAESVRSRAEDSPSILPQA